MVVIHGESRHGGYLDASTGLNEACLSLLEVDDVPDSVKILREVRVGRFHGIQHTHVRLHIFVLEIEGVLPDINTDNRGVSCINH